MRLDPDFGDLRELRAKMVVWAKRLTRGGARAEDLVQEALLKMIANRNRFSPEPGGVEQWARIALLNVFRDGLRVDRRRPHFVDFENLHLTSPDNPETATYCRQVFRLLDPAMVCDLFDWPRTTVAAPTGKRGRPQQAEVSDSPRAVTMRRFKARQAVAQLEARVSA